MPKATDILYVIPRPEIGGAERQLLELIRRLDRTQFTPHVVCLDGTGSLEADYRSAAETVRILNRRGMFDVSVLADLVTIAREIRPDICHTWLYIANLYGGWAARLAGVPTVIASMRGLGIDPRHSTLKRVQHAVLNGFIAQFVDRLAVNAGAVAQRMTGYGYSPQDTTVIHNGVEDVSLFSEDERRAARANLGVGSDEPLLVSVSRIDPKKDLETLIRAFHRIRVRHPEAHLAILGDGFTDYRDRLNKLALDLDVSEKTHFLGFRDDAQSILAAADVSVLSSLTEGFPNAVLESMRFGIPVVSTSVGGVPELIDDGIEGYLVPRGDDTALADRVDGLLAAPERRETMGILGRARALADFGMPAMVSRTENLYREFITPETDVPSPTPFPADIGSECVTPDTVTPSFAPHSESTDLVPAT